MIPIIIRENPFVLFTKEIIPNQKIGKGWQKTESDIYRVGQWIAALRICDLPTGLGYVVTDKIINGVRVIKAIPSEYAVKDVKPPKKADGYNVEGGNNTTANFKKYQVLRDTGVVKNGEIVTVKEVIAPKGDPRQKNIKFFTYILTDGRKIKIASGQLKTTLKEVDINTAIKDSNFTIKTEKEVAENIANAMQNALQPAIEKTGRKMQIWWTVGLGAVVGFLAYKYWNKSKWWKMGIVAGAALTAYNAYNIFKKPAVSVLKSDTPAKDEKTDSTNTNNSKDKVPIVNN